MIRQYETLNPSPLGERGRGEGAAPSLALSEIRTVATLTPNPLSLREGEGAFLAASGGSHDPQI
ncbi:MAG: hypothetical protein CVT79_17525 [Alphaproteobacteria bacterium HGW-Alphaproteobacteria-18]|nr:MAG: hypothetical protein CVT79_17525 [Alphaproteobacteria bacterium HGW-Alphaproteobacteria-18]